MPWRCALFAVLLVLSTATPAFARFATTFAESASAAPIIIRARVQAITVNDEEGVADFQLKVVRTFVRSFAARHLAHNELFPGQVITLSAHPEEFQKGDEYLILLTEKGSLFRVRNHCGTIAKQKVVLWTVPDFRCPGSLLWTLSDVEARLTQPAVCPEQSYRTFSEPENSLSGTPEVLSLEEFDLREVHPLTLLGALWLGVALGAATVLLLRQQRLARRPLSDSPRAATAQSSEIDHRGRSDA